MLDRFEGKPLNSPNDVIVKSDDSIWFSDPPFGILGNYEGHVAPAELPTNVYRVDGRTGQATVATGDIPRPNGLCFSPDEKLLYVVVSGAMPREIRVFDVVDGGTKLANGRVFVNCGPGSPDGLRADTEGNLWCGWGGGEGHDGVAVFNPDGTAHRPHPGAGALRQPLLRRAEAEPALPRRQPVDLLDPRRSPGRDAELSRASPRGARGLPRSRPVAPRAPS